MAEKPEKKEADIAPLQIILERLRDAHNGCDWAARQTFETIIPYTIEEAYETADAVQRGDMAALRDELGDLLLQVVFHSQIAQELGHFDLNDVIDAICQKMIRRRPHILAGADMSPAWEDVKQAERAASGQNDSALSGLANALPALVRAQKIQKRAAHVGFDWDEAAPVFGKLDEEIAEFRAAKSQAEREDELGDMLFTLVNLARKYELDAESALRGSNEKFIRRFQDMESQSEAPLDSLSAEQLEARWRQAKSRE